MVASQNKNLLLALIVNTEQFQNTWRFFFSRTNKKINKNAGSYSGFRLPTFTQYCNTSVYSYFEKGCRKNCARDNPER